MSCTAPPPAGPTRSDPDVLVIGGGIVGLFCAYHLRRAGRTVTVLERGAIGDAEACSSGNTGFVGTQGAAPLAEPGVPAQGLRWLLNPESPFYLKPRWDPRLATWLWHFRRACTASAAAATFEVLLELKQRSLAMLREVCAADPLRDLFAVPGMLVVFQTEQGFEKGRRSVAEAVAGGVPLRVLDPAELRALEPDVEYDVRGALYNEEGAYLRVPAFTRAFAGMLAAQGVDIVEHAEVTGFETTGATISRVRTGRGDFAPAEVVLATGTWSARLARTLGLGLQLQPAKGYSVTVPAPDRAPRLPVLLSEGKVAIAPLGDRLRFGGTLELSGMDSPVSHRRVDGILRTVRTFLPELAVPELDRPAAQSPDTVAVWSGLRPCTPDSLPYLGRAEPYHNLTLACGHGHIGMGLAPAGGHLVAQLVTGERPDLDPAPFRVGRYGGLHRRPRRAAPPVPLTPGATAR